MGQKTNPNILRLGTIKNWKVEFFEKKNKELPLYIFNDLEIYEYIERFLKVRGVFIHDYRQFYSNQTLNLHISYFVTPKKTFKNKTVLKKINPEKIEHLTFKGLNYMAPNFQKYHYFICYSNDLVIFTKTLNDAIKIKDLIIKFLESLNLSRMNDMRHNAQLFDTRRLDIMLYKSGGFSTIKEARKLILDKHILVNKRSIRTDSYILKPSDSVEISENFKGALVNKNLLREKNARIFINNKDTNCNSPNKIYDLRARIKSTSFDENVLELNSIKLENDLKKFVKVISNYTRHKFDTTINFSCINKDFTNYFSIFKDKKIRMLQRFKSTSFFKEGWELLFHVSFNSNSARLLSTFIAEQLKVLKIKQLNFFFALIKRTLTVLISSNLSKLKGVKVIVKGRLSKNIRAKNRILIIGDVAVQTLASNIDYHQTTTHNANGSYGVKVWIVEK